jgi:hypothetical protein
MTPERFRVWVGHELETWVVPGADDVDAHNAAVAWVRDGGEG